MRKFFILTLTLCSLFLILGAMPTHGEAEIYENVLRLHVIANSNDERDQELKLKVRDAILEKTGELFIECQSRDDAANTVEEKRELIEEIARSVIHKEGYMYDVRIELGEEDYPTRSYGSVCFPAGNYLSLRVIIGEGAGENWWCVLYPPMCLSAASAEEEPASIPVGLTSEQYKMITNTDSPKYTVRFKILEAFGK